MRVEAYNQVAKLYKSSKTTKAESICGVAAGRDEVTISQTGHDYQIAKRAVAETSDVREDKIAQLKARVEAGSYHVDSEDFAHKLLERYSTLQ